MEKHSSRKPYNSENRRLRRGGHHGKHRGKALFPLCALAAVVLLAAGLFLLRTGEQAAYPLEYRELILYYAQEYDLDPNMVAAVIHTESRFNPRAESGAGARGLMQVMPETGAWIAGKLGITDFDPDTLYDPDTNIRFGCWYLHYLYSRFDGKDDVVFAAYNTGPTRISTWLENPAYSDGKGNLTHIPIDVTQDYVDKVNHAWKKYKEYYNLVA